MPTQTPARTLGDGGDRRNGVTVRGGLNATVTPLRPFAPSRSPRLDVPDRFRSWRGWRLLV